MVFKEKLLEYQDAINQLLLNYLPKEDGYNDLLIEAMRYSLMAGGKRIRPILMYEVFNICGGSSILINDFMVAMEMIHTYSLIHDDLPAMDNDDLRRGKPTCHIQYGEDIAILAGDALLNNAYEIIFKSISEYPYPNVINAGKLLSKNAGIQGMIGGQVVDVLNENKPIDIQMLDYIHLHKTSALIESAFGIGAYLSDADEDTVNTFLKIGRSIGIAFQIQDDILDVTGNEAILGKPINSDVKNNKVTYVTLKGLETSKAIVDDLLNDGLVLLEHFDEKSTIFIKEFIRYIKDRNK